MDDNGDGEKSPAQTLKIGGCGDMEKPRGRGWELRTAVGVRLGQLSLKSGEGKENSYIMLRIHLPASASTLKHSSLFTSQLGIFQTRGGCILNAFMKLHSSDTPRAPT